MKKRTKFAFLTAGAFALIWVASMIVSNLWSLTGDHNKMLNSVLMAILQTLYFGVWMAMSVHFGRKNRGNTCSCHTSTSCTGSYSPFW